MYSWRHEIIESDLFDYYILQMTKEEKLEAIYKEMANKEVSFGCRYKFIKKYQYCDWAWFEPWDIITLCKRDAKYEDSFLTTFFRDIALIKKDVYDYVELIWHPVMIGTIFEWYSKKRGYINSQFVMNLIEVWDWYDKPIELQSDYCVDFVHSLIKKI